MKHTPINPQLRDVKRFVKTDPSVARPPIEETIKEEMTRLGSDPNAGFTLEMGRSATAKMIVDMSNGFHHIPLIARGALLNAMVNLTTALDRFDEALGARMMMTNDGKLMVVFDGDPNADPLVVDMTMGDAMEVTKVGAPTRTAN